MKIIKMKVASLFLCLVGMLSASQGTAYNLNKRADDTEEWRGILEQHSSVLEHLQAQGAALQTQMESKDRHVAFLAQFSQSDPHIPASGIIQFNTAVINDGNGYDPHLGVFTAPTAGVYILSAQIFARQGQTTRLLLDIKVNGDVHARMAFNADTSSMSMGESSDSTSSIIKLQAGDKVWMTSEATDAISLWGVYHSFFSGALLYSV